MVFKLCQWINLFSVSLTPSKDSFLTSHKCEWHSHYANQQHCPTEKCSHSSCSLPWALWLREGDLVKGEELPRVDEVLSSIVSRNISGLRPFPGSPPPCWIFRIPLMVLSLEMGKMLPSLFFYLFLFPFSFLLCPVTASFPCQLPPSTSTQYL